MTSYVPTLYWISSSSAGLGLGACVLPKGSVEETTCLVLWLSYVTVQRECTPYLLSGWPRCLTLHFPSFVLVVCQFIPNAITLSHANLNQVPTLVEVTSYSTLYPTPSLC